MPIHRYRSIEEVPPAPALDPLDPTTPWRALALSEALARQLPPLFAPGVYRYRSIEEANAAKEEAVIARVRHLHALRSGHGGAL